MYSLKAFHEFLLPYGIARTMSDPGTPTQNGAMESINGWVKTELFIDFDIKDCEDMPSQVRGYIWFFNEERPMCCLGYLTLSNTRKSTLRSSVVPKPQKFVYNFLQYCLLIVD